MGELVHWGDRDVGSNRGLHLLIRAVHTDPVTSVKRKGAAWTMREPPATRGEQTGSAPTQDTPGSEVEERNERRHGTIRLRH